MRFGVVVFPGSNCDDDMMHVMGDVLQAEVVKLWHKDERLPDFDQSDCVILPGGFSFGDYLRAGAIARFSPLMQAIIDFANNGGRVLGICNGFQILCEADLLPGVLLRNDNQLFSCKNVHLKVTSTDSLITRELSVDEVVKIPIAHAEGRFFADEAELDQLEANDQILFKYCSTDGTISAASNPNGSSRNIAGIRNRAGNVMGMMPHPERAAEDVLGNNDGYRILAGLLQRELTV